jgi:hypothetical protein
MLEKDLREVVQLVKERRKKGSKKQRNKVKEVEEMVNVANLMKSERYCISDRRKTPLRCSTSRE